MDKCYTILISCVVIQACSIMALYVYVVPIGTIMQRFSNHSHEVTFSMNPLSFLPAKKGDMNSDFDDVSDESQSTSTVVLQEMDMAKRNRFLFWERPTGRLGNQMFDFASALGVAHALNYTFVMAPSIPLLKYFELNQTLSKSVKNVEKIRIGKWRQNTLNKTNLSRNITLEGNWRIWKIFDNISDIIRKSFTFKPEHLNVAKSFIQSNNPNNMTLIGVHVRRGDFLKDNQQLKGRVVVSKEYIFKAMNWFRRQHKDTRFVVVSDDQSWCRDNISGKDVFFSTLTAPILDMAILSLCNHTVMSTGTFSWWGAWLAGGQVVYCSDFPKPESSLARRIFFNNDYYPPSWIGMSNTI